MQRAELVRQEGELLALAEKQSGPGTDWQGFTLVSHALRMYPAPKPKRQLVRANDVSQEIVSALLYVSD